MHARTIVSIAAIGFFTVSGIFLIETSVKGDEKKSQQARTSESSSNPKPATPVPAGTSPMFIKPSPPKYTVQIYKDSPDQTFSKEEERINKVCELLMQIKPEPAQRLAYFSWINRPDCPFKFRSWGCFLRKADPIKGGWKVTLQAMARGEDAQGNPYDVFNRYIEEYTLTESGKIQFIRGYPHPDEGDGSPRFRRYK